MQTHNRRSRAPHYSAKRHAMSERKTIHRWPYALVVAVGVSGGAALFTTGHAVRQAVDAVPSSQTRNSKSETRNPPQFSLNGGETTAAATIAVELVANAGKGSYQNTSDALSLQRALLEEGLKELRQHPDYTATLSLQERLDGTLKDEQAIHLTLRNEPFSIHMVWPETGREVAYVEGQNDDRLLVRPTGLARLLGTVKLKLNDRRIASGSRFAIKESGILLMAERLIRERRADLKYLRNVVSRRLSDGEIDGRGCYRFSTEYPDLRWNPHYRKLITSIDKQTLLPVRVEHYGGANGELLLGRYTYHDIRCVRRLEDADFRITR